MCTAVCLNISLQSERLVCFDPAIISVVGTRKNKNNCDPEETEINVQDHHRERARETQKEGGRVNHLGYFESRSVTYPSSKELLSCVVKPDDVGDKPKH